MQIIKMTYNGRNSNQVHTTYELIVSGYKLSISLTANKQFCVKCVEQKLHRAVNHCPCFISWHVCICSSSSPMRGELTGHWNIKTKQSQYFNYFNVMTNIITYPYGFYLHIFCSLFKMYIGKGDSGKYRQLDYLRFSWSFHLWKHHRQHKNDRLL